MAHSFLSSYTNKPAPGHMKAAQYVLRYVHSTHDYGISFTLDDVDPIHSYIHYPPTTDVEAYNDALPPSPGRSDTLSTYSNACCSSQLGSAVANGTLLPLFEFLSMSGGIIFSNGHTSLSSCEAEIHATCFASEKIFQFMQSCKQHFSCGTPSCRYLLSYGSLQ